MNNTIYWFSGTGNSLFVAGHLARLMGDTELVPIAGSTPPLEPVGGNSHKIGFVFPSYYGNLPRLVRASVEKLNVLPGTDIFVVVTMGMFGQGSVKAMKELFTKKGLSLRYGTGIRMPANYVLNYDPALFGAKSDSRVRGKLNKADRKIRQIADDIASGKQRIKTHPITAKTLYTNVAALDAAFFTTEICTGCELCEKMCPVKNIKLTGGRPIWLHHCERCMACISWCPVAAIEYGKKTKRRTRYHNPSVKPAELMRKTD